MEMLVKSRLPAWSVLDRFGQMRGFDAFGAGQIGDGARQLKRSVIGAGAHVQLTHSGAQQAVTGLVNRAELADLARPHVGVGSDSPSVG